MAAIKALVLSPFKLFAAIIIFLLYMTSGVIPKRKDLWIFGAWWGEKFADNSKYLFLYVHQNHPEIRGIWLTKNKRVRDDLTRRGYEAYLMRSIPGILYSMVANCAVVSVGIRDVNYFVMKRAKIVQLWHGTPLKKLDYLRASDNVIVRKTILNLLGKNKAFMGPEKYDVVIAASDESKKRISESFQIDLRNVAVTGYPRNDVFFKPSWLPAEESSRFRDTTQSSHVRYIITYLPTHRGEGEKALDLLERYGFDKSSVQQRLEELDAALIIKTHFFHRLEDVHKPDGVAKNIFILTEDEVPDVYPLLTETDLLITDYSSVYFDYLLLNRPIVFAPFDIEEYTKQERELFYDYDEVTPGPKAKDWPEALQLACNILQNDSLKEERATICRRFNKFHDNENSRRVFDVVYRLLQ